MSEQRPPPHDGGAWDPTLPSPLPDSPPVEPRPQPPLKEVIEGLDSRELDGQTVFDQLFGDAPARPR